MNGREILDSAAAKVDTAVVAIAGSLLTSTQIRILANVLSGLPAEEIIAIIEATQPPEAMKSGPLLPLIVDGKLKEFPMRVHDIVVFVLAMMAQSMSEKDMKVRNAVIGGLGGLVQGRIKPMVGSRRYYGPTPDPSFVMPELLRNDGETISPPSVWSALALTPRGYGSGFQGSIELKGTMPDTSAGVMAGQSRAMSSGGANPDKNAAAAAAAAKAQGEEVR